LLLEPLRRRLKELLVWQQVPRIVAAHLGENAACLGAGLLARQAIALTVPNGQPSLQDSIADSTEDKETKPCATP
jgi:glucokinase